MTIITPHSSCLPLSGTINNTTSNYCTRQAATTAPRRNVENFTTEYFRRSLTDIKSSQEFLLKVYGSRQEASEEDRDAWKISKPGWAVEAWALQEISSKLWSFPVGLPLSSRATEKVSRRRITFRSGRVWKSCLHTWVSQKIRYDNNTIITLMLTSFCNVFSRSF